MSNTRIWDKLANRFIPEPNTGCYLWLGPYDKDGYGKISTDDGRYLRAHRYAYELKNGAPPQNLACHSCDNPTCVNPDHIFDGTHKENHGDRGRKNRQAKGERCGQAKLTSEQVLFLRENRPGEKYAFSTFGIARSQYYRILRGASWEHLTNV